MTTNKIPSVSGLVKLNAEPSGVAQTDFPDPSCLVEGHPRRDTWNVVETQVQNGGQLFCGIWRSEPGRWTIKMSSTEHELFTVLNGCCRVYDTVGRFEEIGSGEGLYIPPGFTGDFEVIETLTKTYMIIA